MNDTKNNEKTEVFDEGKCFLDSVKDMVSQAQKLNKTVEYKSETILILSIKDNTHSIFEVYNLNKEGFVLPKISYIGDPGLRKSYLLNLINKEENSVLTKKACI